ncbi:30S ribosomal protein S10 [candidate division WWE3 bacterium CG10_big_fil_rev_8_21_14_0_10_32_10]|uniref:Small ribosomal subunit protein uS10 n=1 Tax=candidate division WWE3 bacterium CG10_big_fil_rev_8_21_14_0_10_32_10 TaxID=1975090 RepID=A0A2H0RB19_UNCKA|nr:MAG: 30S ribosomal protein S10 [candidate division WWE3 bacterium CG10_big_fil_rev_8_21_14_0_10_32_10]
MNKDKKSGLRVKLKSFDPKISDQSAKKIVSAAIRTGSKISGPIPLPTRVEKYTVIRGPHIDKRGKEIFEQRTHKRLIDILDPTPQTVEELSNLSLPAGVEITIRSI